MFTARKIATGLLFLGAPTALFAQAIPQITIGVQQATEPGQVVGTMQILGLLTLMSIAPALVLMMTSFTRLIIVMHFLRQAMGAGQMPPSQLMIGLCLILTFFIMQPAIEQINTEALKPY
ncbi:flagellar biosynthetic protein FliP, partial [bacterium]|nr:flagellar biosynthetic protein FliP [bacterium]